jgi:hypothetical protein
MLFLDKYELMPTRRRGARSKEQSLEMFRYLAEKTYQINMSLESASVETMKQMAGTVGENMIADLTRGQVVAREFDVLVLEDHRLTNGIDLRIGDRIEVKSAVIQTDGSCIAYSLGGKEKYCDFVALVDMTRQEDDIRISIIPADVFFTYGAFNGKKERFGWSGSYNKNDRIRVKNTEMFLEYEVLQ